ncbi:MAG: helix-turn-helix transcriptional regulator [Deltaproteobacteria bacterium]|nr:helix-turn-helix transcriptional regulator [Deltaproteobacteria bacterium]
MININNKEETVLKTLGDRLREARLARNESQEVFAQRLGLARQSYGKMEKGNPSIPVGYWLQASSILGRLDTWGKVLQEQEDLFLQYEQNQAGRKKAGRRRTSKT